MQSSPVVLRVFCDFDGTVAVNDVGDILVRTFGTSRCDEIIQEYELGKIGAKECWKRACETVRGLTPEQLHTFTRQQTLDPYFSSFVDCCAERGIPYILLSDGFDVYLEEILRQHGFVPGGDHARGVQYFANHLEFAEGGRIVPSFPYEDAECEVCANCKRNHILSLSGDDDVIVYIGDGHSDFCAVEYADIVFAKRALIGHCQSKNISFYEFETFRDVIDRLEKLLSQKRIRKRWQATLRRREVFRVR